MEQQIDYLKEAKDLIRKLCYEDWMSEGIWKICEQDFLDMFNTTYGDWVRQLEIGVNNGVDVETQKKLFSKMVDYLGLNFKLIKDDDYNPDPILDDTFALFTIEYEGKEIEMTEKLIFESMLNMYEVQCLERATLKGEQPKCLGCAIRNKCNSKVEQE